MNYLPLCLLYATSFIVVALSVAMVAAVTGLTAVAATRTSLSQTARHLAPIFIGSLLAAWLALAFVVADGGNFPLSRPDLRRLISAIVALGPLIIGIGLLFGSKTIRAINTATPPAWLIRIQTYRVAGALFLFPFMTHGVFPVGFALPAGIGDAITGLLAPVVACAVARNRPNAFAWAVAWNLFGTLDLIVAPIAATISEARVLTTYPIALVPLFLGPPLGILLHVCSLRNLVVAEGRAPSRP